MLALALRLAGFGWQWLKRLFTAYPWQVLLALSLCWGVYERKHHIEWRNYAKALKEASRANVAALKAAKAKVEATRAQITGDTNHATVNNRAAALAAGNAYAASHRVRWPSEAPAARDASGGVPVPAATAGSVEAPGEAIAVAPDAFNACTLNTSDLNTAVEWAAKVWGK